MLVCDGRVVLVAEPVSFVAELIELLVEEDVERVVSGSVNKELALRGSGRSEA